MAKAARAARGPGDACRSTYVKPASTQVADERQRSRSKPLLRARGTLCPRRRECGRGRRAHGRHAAYRAAKGSDASNAAALGAGSRRAEGADHEGGAAPRHHPGSHSAGIRRRTAEAAARGAADGRCLRQAPDAGGTRSGLAGAGSAPSTSSPAAAASLGQVHRATTKEGAPLACKLQYPDMQSAVEADLKQLEFAFALHRRLDPAIDTREIAKEIGERVREELDYAPRSEACRALLRRRCAACPSPRACTSIPLLSTRRLLTLGWLEGEKILCYSEAPIEIRNRLAVAMFKAWWHPFSHAAVIHGDPHLGNYTVFSEDGEAAGHQPARLRLHPHLPSELRRRRRRSLPRPPARRPRARSSTPTRPGDSSGSRRS